LPLPPPAWKELLVGVIEYVQFSTDPPNWTTLSVWPPTKIAPCRVPPVKFSLTSYVTNPLPLPLPAEVMIIQFSPVVASQLHPPGAVTFMLQLPPLEGQVCSVGEIE
jgi:hypothetical protein